MNVNDILTSWSELRDNAPSRRRALKLLGGLVLGVGLVPLNDEPAEAARCRKRGLCSRKQRCCKGFVCKRGRCRKKPTRRRPGQPGNGGATCPAGEVRCDGVCTNVFQDPKHCGICGNDCGSFTCADGFCAITIGESGSGEGQFRGPVAVAIGPDGATYVTETFNHRVQVLSPGGEFRRAFGTFGSGDGEFNAPTGIALTRDGDIYVADFGNHRIQQFRNDGTHVRSWGTFGTGSGQFRSPIGVATVGNTVVVADAGNHRVQRFNLTGFFLGQFGGLGSEDGKFNDPRGIAIDPVLGGDQEIFVADSLNDRIQVFDLGGTFRRTIGQAGAGPGQFFLPEGVEVDRNGNLFVADSLNHRVQAFTTAGAFRFAIGREGTAVGEFETPVDLAVSSSGILTVADIGNDRLQSFDLNRGVTAD